MTPKLVYEARNMCLMIVKSDFEAKIMHAINNFGKARTKAEQERASVPRGTRM